MIVDATKIEELIDCYPNWLIPYQVIELDADELRENKAFTTELENEILNVTTEEVLSTLKDICLKESIGLDSSNNYKKLLAIYYLIEYLNILKGELSYCGEGTETYSEFIKRKKVEFEIECIRKSFACDYDLTDIFEDIYKKLEIPTNVGTFPGLGSMTINIDDCNIYTVHKVK